MTHETRTGAPCIRHVPRAEDLIAPATMATACFAAMHDLASGLQAIAVGLDELEAAIGADSRLRALLEEVTAANAKAIAMFVGLREIGRDSGPRRDRIELSQLLAHGVMRAREHVVVSAVPARRVVVTASVVTHVLVSLIDAATGENASSGVEVSVSLEGLDAVIAVRAAVACPAPATIGATLAIAGRVLAAQGGSLRCGEHDGREEYTVRLPTEAR